MSIGLEDTVIGFIWCRKNIYSSKQLYFIKYSAIHSDSLNSLGHSDIGDRAIDNDTMIIV
tara:strand:+ start:290 stop:469 length:180 start_codon:yes stop_codon:yes gene_type:complete